MIIPALRIATFPVLLVAGLLLPGWLLGRVLRTPVGITGSFLGSAAVLLNVLLALDALRLPLNALCVSGSLGGCCSILAIIAHGRKSPAAAVVPTTPSAPPAGFGTWVFYGSALIGFAAIAVRALADPLSGFDTLFRWDFLARQIYRLGDLQYYPPITADDFLRYAWCDGIAPLVSSLYLWSYWSVGQVAPWATAPAVIGQAALLFGAVYALARERGGSRAGMIALGFLAASPVLLFAVAIGQETALTAISLTAMFLFLEKDRQQPTQRWLVWAGIAAGVGALAREYGLVFVGFGAVMLAARRTSRRGWLHFVAAAAVVAVPWYLRNWIKSGNPLFAQTLGGLFPGNVINEEMFSVIAELRGIGTAGATWADLVVLLLRLAGIPLAFGLLGLVLTPRDRMPWAVTLAVIVALWLWSIGQTAGGVVYSMRVLTPALALSAVLAGVLIARFTSKIALGAMAVLLAVAAVDSGERSLFMPVDPHVAWWRARPLAWLARRDYSREWNRHRSWADLADAADGRKIVVSDPYAHAILSGLGAQPVPLFSPAVRFLFDPAIDFAHALQRLRDDNVRFILLPIHNPFDEAQQARHPFFRALRSSAPTVTFPTCRVFDLMTAAFQPPASDRATPSPQ